LGDIILKGADTIVNYQYHDLLFNELEDEALSAEVGGIIFIIENV
jgi:hypothetical protein